MVEGQPIQAERKLEDEPRLYKFFRAAVKMQASDLHLKVGQPPKVRLYGQLKNTTAGIMSAEMVEQMAFEIMSTAQKEIFQKEGTLDFAHEIGGEDRFRINVFRQRGVLSLVARRVNSTVPAFGELHLPAVLEKICDRAQGLILVTGPAGGGKTTTIAAMIDFINRSRSCHIVTIEDPIEYLFQDKKAIVTQREIGLDVKDYDEALKYLVRQDPDVIFVGEMRDARTVTAGMRAAETGRLVFGTIHSANASQAVHRILDLFTQNERDLARQTLSLTVEAIISQMLVPSIKEGVSRMPVVEILLANPAVRKLTSEGREADLPTVIRSCQNEGMQDFTYNLCELIKNGSVDPKEAYKIAPNIEELKMALKGIRGTASGIL
jgi:twitching motility protein PilT